MVGAGSVWMNSFDFKLMEKSSTPVSNANINQFSTVITNVTVLIDYFDVCFIWCANHE